MDSNHNKIVGERVRDLYKAHGMTQAELAEKLGYSDPNTISMIVNGRRSLTQEKAMMIVDLFPDTRLDWLMGREQESPLYKLSVEIAIREALDKSFHSFLYGTPYYLLTPEEIRKYGENIQPSPLVDYVLFKGDELITLSTIELECFYSLIKSLITTQIDFLFQQKEATKKNAELVKALRKLKNMEQTDSKGSTKEV